MIAEVTAGCSSTNASARWTSETPASSASVGQREHGLELAGVLRQSTGRAVRAGARRGSRSAASRRRAGSDRTASRRPAGSTAAPPRSAARRPAAPRAPRRGPGSSTAAARPPAAPARARARRTAPRRAATAGRSSADVADLAGVHEVAQRAEGLLDVGVRLGPVHLVEVDPVGLQPTQAVLDLADDPPARVADRFTSSPIRPWNLVARTTSSRRPLQRLADDRLGLALRVDVGGVDEVDARVEGAVDDPDAVGVVGVAVAAEHHRAQGQRADLQAGPAEGAVLRHAEVLSVVGECRGRWSRRGCPAARARSARAGWCPCTPSRNRPRCLQDRHDVVDERLEPRRQHRAA